MIGHSDLQHLTAKSNAVCRHLQGSLYEYTFMVHSENDFQHIVDRFAKASKLFNLTISLEKTKVLHPPAPNHSIFINGCQVSSGEALQVTRQHHIQQ